MISDRSAVPLFSTLIYCVLVPTSDYNAADLVRYEPTEGAQTCTSIQVSVLL